MKKLLLCIDHIDDNSIIIKYTVEIAKHMQAKVTVFHTYFIPIVMGDSLQPGYPDIELIEKDERTSVEKICEKIRAEIYSGDGRSIECEAVVNFNLRVPGILEEAEGMSANLIIMGSRCVSSLQKLFGTTSTQIASKSNIPVMVIPNQVHYTGFKHIIYSTDLTEVPDDVLKVIEFAKMFNSHLDIVHVNDFEFDGTDKINFATFQERVEGKSDYNNLEFNSITHKNWLPSLIEYVKHKEGELLIMYKHRYPFILGLFHKSKTNEMIFNSEFPILVLQ